MHSYSLSDRRAHQKAQTLPSAAFSFIPRSLIGRGLQNQASMIRTTSFVFHVQLRVETPLPFPPAHRFLRQFEIDMPRGWQFKVTRHSIG